MNAVVDPVPVYPVLAFDPSAASAGVLSFVVFMCVGIVIIIGAVAYIVRDR